MAVNHLRIACMLQLIVCVAPLHAQDRSAIPSISFGARTGVDIDAAGRDISRSLVGVELRYHITRRWSVGPSFDYYVNLPGAVRFNFDTHYRLPVLWNVSYLGAGFTFPNDDGPHNYPGANAFLGFSTRVTRSLTPFAEARWVFFPSYTSFTILSGMHVGM